MAQKRMIDKKISVSEQVSNLKPIGMLIYTWMIPHADDAGLLPANPKTIRAMVCPMLDIKVEDFGFHLEDMRKQNLIRLVSIENHDYFLVSNFHEYQTLKKDRQPQTLIKLDRSKSPQDNWKTLESIVFHLEDKGFLNGSEVNGNEVNRSEPKVKEEKGVQREEEPTPEEPAIVPAPLASEPISNDPFQADNQPSTRLSNHLGTLGVEWDQLNARLQESMTKLYTDIYESGNPKDQKSARMIENIIIATDEYPDWDRLDSDRKIIYVLHKFSSLSGKILSIPQITA